MSISAAPADSPHLAARPSLTRLAGHAADAGRQLRLLAGPLPPAGTAQRGLLACHPASAEAAVLGVEHPDGAEVRLNPQRWC